MQVSGTIGNESEGADVTGGRPFMFERPSKFGEVPNGLEKAKCCACLQKEQKLPKLL